VNKRSTSTTQPSTPQNRTDSNTNPDTGADSKKRTPTTGSDTTTKPKVIKPKAIKRKKKN